MIKGGRRTPGCSGKLALGPAKTDPSEYEKAYLIPKLPTTATGVRLMGTLVSYGYDGKEISASVGTLAASAGISERSVQRSLREFVARGWLTVIYQSRGLADESGQRTNKYRLNWPDIVNAAIKNHEKNRGKHAERRKRQADAFRRRQLRPPDPNPSTAQPKGDTKGDKGPRGQPPKGVRLTGNQVHLGEAAINEASTSNGTEDTLSSEGVDLPSCSWDSELDTEGGTRFETEAGPVWIPADVAERWVGWERIDGAAVLRSALQYMKRHAWIAPNRTTLLMFLAEYARKVALGYQGRKLDQMLAAFGEVWIENKAETSTAA